MTASADFVEGLGQLALIGSIGFGVVMGKRENADWSYEYKVGNELSEGEADLALIEESPASVMEKVSSRRCSMSAGSWLEDIAAHAFTYYFG